MQSLTRAKPDRYTEIRPYLPIIVECCWTAASKSLSSMVHSPIAAHPQTQIQIQGKAWIFPPPIVRGYRENAWMSCASCGSADAGRCHTSPRLPVWSGVMWALLSSISTSDWWCGWRAAGLIWHQCRGEPCCVIWALSRAADFICVMFNGRIRSGDGELCTLPWWGELLFFYSGGWSLIGYSLLVAVSFERRHSCWRANVLEYSEDLQLRPVHMKHSSCSGYSEVKVSADSRFK